MVNTKLALCFTVITVLLKSGLTANVTALGCISTVCYWVVDVPGAHWDQAGKQCRDFKGSSLATIEDDETNTFLWTKTHQLGVEPFIGVVSMEIPWRWVNGTSYNERIEDTEGEADCNGCALLKLNEVDSESNILAGDCFLEQPFACSKTGQTSTNWKLEFVSSSTETWPKARERCRQMGMDLAVFPDIPLGSVAAFLKMQTSFSNFWIGAYSRKWISASSGREVFYTKARGGACNAQYVFGLKRYWPSTGYCCQPSLCALGESGGSMSPSGEGDKESTQSGQEGLNVVYQIIIPLLCSLLVCVIVIIVTCVIWRKITRQMKKLTDDLERRYAAHSSRSKNGAPQYEELHLQDDHAYVEIKG